MKSSDNELTRIQQDIFQLINKHLVEGVEPLAIAGMLASTTLSLYKTLLPGDDYSAIVKYMYESRDEIQPISHHQPTIQ